jgi:hypothetical protein
MRPFARARGRIAADTTGSAIVLWAARPNAGTGTAEFAILQTGSNWRKQKTPGMARASHTNRGMCRLRPLTRRLCDMIISFLGNNT